MSRAVFFRVLVAPVLVAMSFHFARGGDAGDEKEKLDAPPKVWRSLAVVTFAGYDAFKADARAIGELFGAKRLDRMVEGMLQVATKGNGLDGIDPKRAWIVHWRTDGERVAMNLFLPVEDSKTVLETLDSLANPPIPRELKKDWLTLAFTADDLVDAHADPDSLAKIVGTDFVRFRFFLRNAGDNVLHPLLQNIGLVGGSSLGFFLGDPQIEDEFKRDLVRLDELEFFQDLARDVDIVEGSIRLNRETNSIVLESEISIDPESPTGKGMAALEAAPAPLGRFSRPDADYSIQLNGALLPSVSKALRARAASLGAIADSMTEKDSALVNPKTLFLPKPILRMLSAVRLGDCNGHMNLAHINLDGKSASGTAVSDGRKLEKEFAAFLENEVKRANGAITAERQEVQGMILHKITGKTSRDLVSIVGTDDRTDPVITFGFGEGFAVLSEGGNSADFLKEVFASKAEFEANPPLFSFAVSSSKLVRGRLKRPPQDDAEKESQAQTLAVLSSVVDRPVRFSIESTPAGALAKFELPEMAMRLLAVSRSSAAKDPPKREEPMEERLQTYAIHSAANGGTTFKIGPDSSGWVYAAIAGPGREGPKQPPQDEADD